ncbi:MAG: hypothetical protein WBO34_01265 [Gammaproteobacteria bacterium]
MKTINMLVISTLLMSPMVLSDEMNLYNGTWQVIMITNKGETRKGTVVFTDQEGIWDINHMNVKKPCIGRQAPVVIKEASADVLVFEIFKSKSLLGCGDYTATLKPVNDTTLKGELDNGRQLTLIRK